MVMPQSTSVNSDSLLSKRRLLSAGLGVLAVPESRLRSKTDGAFAALAHQLWSSFPASIQSADTVFAFKL